MRILVASTIAVGLISLGHPLLANADAPVTRPRAALFLTSESPLGSFATFGPEATRGSDATRAVMEIFKSVGVEQVSIHETSHPRSLEKDLPLDDSAALALAGQAAAGLAVVAGIVGKDEGKIRATDLVGQGVDFRIRVLEVGSGAVLFDRNSHRAGYGSDAKQAFSQATSIAIQEATKGLDGLLRARFTEAGDATALTLTIKGATGWRPIAAVFQKLAATKGVRAVHAMEIADSRVKLRVSSQQSAATLVASLRRTRIANGRISVRMEGNSIAIVILMNVPVDPVVNG